MKSESRAATRFIGSKSQEVEKSRTNPIYQVAKPSSHFHFTGVEKGKIPVQGREVKAKL